MMNKLQLIQKQEMRTVWNVFFTLVFMVIFSVLGFGQGTWIQKNNLYSPLNAPYSAVIGNKAYVNGMDGYYNNSSVIEEYDQVTDTWSYTTTIPFGTQGINFMLAINNKLYLSSVSGAVYEFDPSTNIWTPKANFLGGARFGSFYFSVGGKGYVGGGYAYPNYMSDFYEYDPIVDTWTAKPQYAGGIVARAASFVIGNKGYVGIGETGPYDNFTRFFEYDPTLEQWTQKASFGGGGRKLAASFSINSRGYIGSGAFYNSNDNGLLDMWEFEPTSNTSAPKRSASWVY